MKLHGYVRTRPGEISRAPQVKALRRAGCVELHIEEPRDRRQKVLEALLAKIGVGDAVEVSRLNRISTDLIRRREMAGRILEVGAHIISLRENLDTRNDADGIHLNQLLYGPKGAHEKLSDLLAATELAPDSTLDSQTVHDEVRRNKKRVAVEQYIADLEAIEDEWVSIVLELRPHTPWLEIADRLNKTSTRRRWNYSSLLKAVRAFVWCGRLPSNILAD